MRICHRRAATSCIPADCCIVYARSAACGKLVTAAGNGCRSTYASGYARAFGNAAWVTTTVAVILWFSPPRAYSPVRVTSRLPHGRSTQRRIDGVRLRSAASWFAARRASPGQHALRRSSFTAAASYGLPLVPMTPLPPRGNIRRTSPALRLARAKHNL